MKKISFLVSSFLIIFSASQAQSFKIGVKAGANLNKLEGRAFKEEFDLGYQLGAFSEIDFSKKFGIQPEVMLNQVNTRKASTFDQVTTGWQDSTGSISLKYLSIPVLLRYNVGNLLTLNLGPQFGILIDQDKTFLKNGEEAFKSGDFSLVGGAQINLKMLRIYGRYNVGLSDISDFDNQDKWKNQQVQLGVGLRL
ncbi:MAG: PorT family protein [Segetibacter sp.]|nr:PorT family protein [Segetibacter sp.]